MEGKDPGRGYGEQQGALEGLEQLQQQMQQSQAAAARRGLPHADARRRPQEGGNEPAAGEKVEIPDEDPFQAPREFRKDLMDAMKQGAPERTRNR